MCALGGQALTDYSPRDLVEVAGLEAASFLSIFYAPFSPSGPLPSFLPSSRAPPSQSDGTQSIPDFQPQFLHLYNGNEARTTPHKAAGGVEGAMAVPGAQLGAQEPETGMVTRWDTHLPPRGSGPAQGLLLSAFSAIHSGPRRGQAWHQPPAHSAQSWRSPWEGGSSSWGGSGVWRILPRRPSAHWPPLPEASTAVELHVIVIIGAATYYN